MSILSDLIKNYLESGKQPRSSITIEEFNALNCQELQFELISLVCVMNLILNHSFCF